MAAHRIFSVHSGSRFQTDFSKLINCSDDETLWSFIKYQIKSKQLFFRFGFFYFVTDLESLHLTENCDASHSQTDGLIVSYYIALHLILSYLIIESKQ